MQKNENTFQASPDLIVGMDAIAQYIGRSRPTARLMAVQDQLPAVRIRGRWMSSRAMLDNYMAARVRKGSSCP